jgi:hypothetical protein
LGLKEEEFEARGGGLARRFVVEPALGLLGVLFTLLLVLFILVVLFVFAGCFGTDLRRLGEVVLVKIGLVDLGARGGVCERVDDLLGVEGGVEKDGLFIIFAGGVVSLFKEGSVECEG